MMVGGEGKEKTVTEVLKSNTKPSRVKKEQSSSPTKAAPAASQPSKRRSDTQPEDNNRRLYPPSQYYHYRYSYHQRYPPYYYPPPPPSSYYYPTTQVVSRMAPLMNDITSSKNSIKIRSTSNASSSNGSFGIMASDSTDEAEMRQSSYFYPSSSPPPSYYSYYDYNQLYPDHTTGGTTATANNYQQCENTSVSITSDASTPQRSNRRHENPDEDEDAVVEETTSNYSSHNPSSHKNEMDKKYLQYQYGEDYYDYFNRDMNYPYNFYGPTPPFPHMATATSSQQPGESDPLASTSRRGGKAKSRSGRDCSRHWQVLRPSNRDPYHPPPYPASSSSSPYYYPEGRSSSYGVFELDGPNNHTDGREKTPYNYDMYGYPMMGSAEYYYPLPPSHHDYYDQESRNNMKQQYSYNQMDRDGTEDPAIPVPPTPSSPTRKTAPAKVTPPGTNAGRRQFQEDEGASTIVESSSIKKTATNPVKTPITIRHATFPAVTPSSVRKAKESECVTLQDTDIVVGRGAPTNFHIGNQYFRELVAEYHTTYFCAKRSDKPLIALKVLDILHDRGARFVRRQKGAGHSAAITLATAGPLTTPGGASWVVVSDKLAYEKVCAALRDGAPEVQRRMMSSSQKIREALLREHTPEQTYEEKTDDSSHADGYDHPNSAIGWATTDSFDKENGYN